MGPTVARALEGHGELHGRMRQNLVERQRPRSLDVAADLELPFLRLDDRDVVVRQKVVEADGRDR